MCPPSSVLGGPEKPRKVAFIPIGATQPSWPFSFCGGRLASRSLECEASCKLGDTCLRPNRGRPHPAHWQISCESSSHPDATVQTLLERYSGVRRQSHLPEASSFGLPLAAS